LGWRRRSVSAGRSPETARSAVAVPRGAIIRDCRSRKPSWNCRRTVAFAKAAESLGWIGATPKKAEKPVQSKVDHLLPPGAESIDALLPPGDTSAPTAKETGSVVPITPATIKAKAASLLPPGADEVEVATGEMQQVALPEKEMEEAARPNLPLRADDGQVVKLHEPVKTVGKGVEERELHVLPPEEKRHRRFKWNLAFYVFAIAVLLAVFYVLTNWR
jgi:hypothetical protein